MPDGGALDTDFYHGNHIPKSVKKVNVLHPGGTNQDIVLYDFELVGKGLGAYENSSKDYYKGKNVATAVVYNYMVRGMKLRSIRSTTSIKQKHSTPLWYSKYLK